MQLEFTVMLCEASYTLARHSPEQRDHRVTCVTLCVPRAVSKRDRNTQTRQSTKNRKLQVDNPVKTDVNILNKVPANRIPKHIKRIIRHDHVGFIPGM